jgi:hypothetical protein
VLLHTIADDLAPALAPALRARLGDRLARMSTGYRGPRSGYDVSSVWLRDVHPHFVRDADGRLEVVTFPLGETRAQPLRRCRQRPRPAAAPRSAAVRQPARRPPLAADPRGPLLHEHGNLVSTGEWALVNREDLRGQRGAARGAAPRPRRLPSRGRDEVRAILADALRLEPGRLVELPSMPGERTGHVDTFVLALGPRELMVPEIRGEQLDALGYAHERELGHEVRGFSTRRPTASARSASPSSGCRCSRR